MEKKFLSKFPLQPRKHLSRAICQARLSVCPPALSLPSSRTSPRYPHFLSFSTPLLCAPSSFSTLLSALGGVLFAFKWQHFNLHAKSARRPPGRHPLPLSRPDFHLNSQNGADSAGLQNFLLKDSMRITRMLGIKKRAREVKGRTRGSTRGEAVEGLTKEGWEERNSRSTGRYSPR